MTKKLTMLAVAIAALTAFVVPASASAAEWQFEGKILEVGEEVELSGPFGFAAGTNGFHAKWDAVLFLEAGSTGTVTSLDVTECTGTGGLTGLTCDATVSNLPWTVHCNENGGVTITGVDQANHYTPSGLAPSTTLTGNVVATGEGGSLDSVSLSGEGTLIEVFGSQIGASVTGSLEAATPGYSCG